MKGRQKSKRKKIEALKQAIRGVITEAKGNYFDYGLMAVLIFLLCFGLVMLYSTSFYSAQLEQNGNGAYYFQRQLIASAVGLGMMYFVSRLDYHAYARLKGKIYWLSFFLLALVQTPLGVEANGARRWIRVPVFGQFQPSEFTKIAIILFIPFVICMIGNKAYTKKGAAAVILYSGFAAAGVLVLTDNLSTAVIVMGIACVIFFVVYPKTKKIAALSCFILIGGLTAGQIAGRLLESAGDFRLWRILYWVDPEKYAQGGAFQTMQGLLAVGSGGIFGKGLGNSAQKMIIPEPQNDMILTIICEELGMFGLLVVLILFGMLMYRLIFIAQNAPDLYGALIATGIFAHIAIQVVLNVAVVLNVIPTTGITLPFISYGGSSVLLLLCEMGIALNISRQIRI